MKYNNSCSQFTGARIYTAETVPFRNARERQIHYAKHGHKFGAADEFDYERMADMFMSQPMHADLFECINPTGDHDRNRIEGTTRFFGVAYGSSLVRTLHIKTASQIAAKGGPLGYVLYKCSEVFP